MENNSHAKTIWAIIAVVVVAILIFVVPGEDTPDETTEGTADISVKETDLENAQDQDDKLPEGFPRDIPVTGDNVVESYSSEYKDRGYTLHTVAYDTTDSISSLHAFYEGYMLSAGYEISDSSAQDNLASISGTLEGNDLSIVVTDRGSLNRVSLNYLERE